MEKLGVEINTTKAASAVKSNMQCPVDGCELFLIADSNPMRCPVHGTEPFESTEE